MLRVGESGCKSEDLIWLPHQDSTNSLITDQYVVMALFGSTVMSPPDNLGSQFLLRRLEGSLEADEHRPWCTAVINEVII